MIAGSGGRLVTSRKLLRRLERYGFIQEPPIEERPPRPSAREWGGRRGYCYVTYPPGAPVVFEFEGSKYALVRNNDKDYIYAENS